MKTMEIHVPTEMEHCIPDLRLFMDMMVRKLHLNRHKGYATNETPASMLEGVEREVEELTDALMVESQFNVFLEAADVANMAFLTGLAVVRMTKPEFEADRFGQRPVMKREFAEHLAGFEDHVEALRREFERGAGDGGEAPPVAGTTAPYLRPGEPAPPAPTPAAPPPVAIPDVVPF